ACGKNNQLLYLLQHGWAGAKENLRTGRTISSAIEQAMRPIALSIGVKRFVENVSGCHLRLRLIRLNLGVPHLRRRIVSLSSRHAIWRLRITNLRRSIVSLRPRHAIGRLLLA